MGLGEQSDILPVIGEQISQPPMIDLFHESLHFSQKLRRKMWGVGENEHRAVWEVLHVSGRRHVIERFLLLVRTLCFLEWAFGQERKGLSGESRAPTSFCMPEEDTKFECQ